MAAAAGALRHWVQPLVILSVPPLSLCAIPADLWTWSKNQGLCWML